MGRLKNALGFAPIVLGLAAALLLGGGATTVLRNVGLACVLAWLSERGYKSGYKRAANAKSSSVRHGVAFAYGILASGLALSFLLGTGEVGAAVASVVGWSGLVVFGAPLLCSAPASASSLFMTRTRGEVMAASPGHAPSR